MMFYLNTRHRLPQISIHQRWSTVDKAAVIPAQVHTNNRQAYSNKGATQVSIDIDNYPSRKALGARNMTDFTRERGQKGISDAKSATSARTQRGWSFVENGAKRGDDIPQKYKSAMMAKYQTAQNLVRFSLMPPPTIRVNPAQVVGEPDIGDVTADIKTTDHADIKITPGSAETQVADKGFIRHFVTEGHYDIYA